MVIMRQPSSGLSGRLVQNGGMKIRAGKYHSQFGLGIWYTWVNGIKYLVFDFGLVYIEIVFKDYDNLQTQHE